MSCYISKQIADNAHAMGIEQAQEIAIENAKLEKLSIAKRWLSMLGKRHSKIGFRPMMESKAYLDAYAKQYAKEFII